MRQRVSVTREFWSVTKPGKNRRELQPVRDHNQSPTIPIDPYRDNRRRTGTVSEGLLAILTL